MGNRFDDDEFDMSAIEARHMEMEAEAQLEAEAERQLRFKQALKEKGDGEGAAAGNCPESDWEAIVEAVLFTMGHSVELRQLAIAIGQSEKVARRVVENLQKRYEEENQYNPLSYMDWIQVLEAEAQLPQYYAILGYEEIKKCQLAESRSQLSPPPEAPAPQEGGADAAPQN